MFLKRGLEQGGLVLESAYCTKIVKKNNFSSNKKDLGEMCVPLNPRCFLYVHWKGHRVLILTLPQKSCSNNFLNQGMKKVSLFRGLMFCQTPAKRMWRDQTENVFRTAEMLQIRFCSLQAVLY